MAKSGVFDVLLRQWHQHKHIVQLKWMQPEWLRALVIILVVAPVFIGGAFVAGVLFLIVPLVILVKFFGISWALVIWLFIYGYGSLRFVRWLRRQQKNRPRRSRVMH